MGIIHNPFFVFLFWGGEGGQLRNLLARLAGYWPTNYEDFGIWPKTNEDFLFLGPLDVRVQAGMSIFWIVDMHFLFLRFFDIFTKKGAPHPYESFAPNSAPRSLI